MNRDNEAFENFEECDRLEGRFLEWLKTDAISRRAHPLSIPGDNHLQGSSFPKSSADDPALWEVDDFDPLLSEELQFLPISEMGSAIRHAPRTDCESSDGAGHSVSDVDQLFRPGDTPVISERSQTIIKSRLRTEIEHHPPLFPWETEIVDYEPESIDFPQGNLVPSIFNGKSPGNQIGFWAHQLPYMNSLEGMPQDLLTQLLEQCTQAVKSNLREWAKLVDVVEKTLFPGRLWELNQIANRLSIAQQHRSSLTIDPSVKQKTGEVNGEISYELATPNQQMLMSLLAAREIMGNLTLELSSTKPRVEREWLTALGLLTLEISYYPRMKNVSSVVKVAATLPCGGSVRLSNGQSQTKSERANPGELSIELCVSEAIASANRDLEQNYLLEVHLNNPEQNSLTFAVYIMPSGTLRERK
ncbi:hypothetical protein [Planktothricoides raciborskii]|uniref:PatU n=1 Tax=Planktothricoides raciborskii FACHB-1370 TaxID=2949576 RepID=A0ABR8EFU8_9CYAN|nr:hypothetical protein [Planktothricoides raciborskii]MBD2545360.1 hypothetical protein [Planktothricoides raciborskii FACHB-1370]MBD2583215.1 hypothetical protein [Planktothricoides raciborskii FACHB-1261]